MKKLYSLFISFLILACSASPTFAISESVLDFLDLNNIFYYNPESTNKNCYPGIGSFDGIVTAGLSPQQSAFIDRYYDIAATLGAEYGIPWETVMAQGILESGAGTSRFALERNNFFGIGAFDSNPNNARSFASPAEGWKGYFENIKNTPTYSAHGAFNYANDPYGYLVAIKEAGYATDPNYISKVGSLIKAVENRATEKNWNLSSQTTKTTTHTSSILMGCSYGSQGNHDLNSTAINLSWPDSSHSPDDPKPEYKAALNTTGVASLGDNCSMAGKSCDAFVATALRYSGADENVPCCGAARMLAYFASHPDLYEEIPNLGNSSNLQPGDIRAKPSHVEMFVLLPDGSTRIASASHCDRTADHARSFYQDSGYRIFRRKL